MACGFTSTEPVIGDTITALLRKIVQSLGMMLDCPDETEWNLVAKIAIHYGATPRPGDSLPDLWQKILRALGDNTCHCGDWETNALKRILDRLSPGAWKTGDSIYQILWKIAEAVA